MTNQDTLVLLSGLAPKEPQRWALDEWDYEFAIDYPKPVWTHDEHLMELLWRASVACRKARYGDYYSASSMRDDRDCLVFKMKAKDEWAIQCWMRWREELLEEWTRNEWPLIWAKNRIQAASS